MLKSKFLQWWRNLHCNHLRRGQLKVLFQLLGCRHHSHPAPAAAHRRLDDHGVSEGGRIGTTDSKIRQRDKKEGISPPNLCRRFPPMETLRGRRSPGSCLFHVVENESTIWKGHLPGFTKRVSYKPCVLTFFLLHIPRAGFKIILAVVAESFSSGAVDGGQLSVCKWLVLRYLQRHPTTVCGVTINRSARAS